MTEPLLLTVPAETLNDETVRLIAWHVSNGQLITEQQLLVEIETSKAIVEMHAPTAGFVWYKWQPGEDLPVGSVLCAITEKDEVPDWSEKADAVDPSNELRNHTPEPLYVRQRIAVGENVGITSSYLSPLASQIVADLEKSSSTFSLPVLAGRGSSKNPAPQDMSREKFLVAPRWQRLAKSKIAEAHLLAEGKAETISSSVMLMFPMVSFRTAVMKRNLQVSLSAILISEVAQLLQKYPTLNCVYREDEIGYYDDINIGWAIGEGQDLLVTVIPQASAKTLKEIDGELQRRLNSYVKGRFSADELTGATFTISDMSGDGASLFIPLISAKQSAILGVGADFITLSFDHQVANGRLASQFLRDLAGRLHAHQMSSSADISAKEELHCTHCKRGTADLIARKAVLMPCEWPEAGHICSLCLLGY